MDRHAPTTQKASSGFTLMEIVIAMAVFTVMATLITKLAGNLTAYSLRFNQSIFTQQELQQTLQIMLPEIRSAVQSQTGGYPIEAAATSTFTFYSDIDKNGLIDRVRYFASGTIFKKGVVTPTGSPLGYVTSSEVVTDLVHNVSSSPMIFTYYDSAATSSNSTALTSPIDVLKIRTVRVGIAASQAVSTSTPSVVTVEGAAMLRNLRF